MTGYCPGCGEPLPPGDLDPIGVARGDLSPAQDHIRTCTDGRYHLTDEGWLVPDPLTDRLADRDLTLPDRRD